MSTPIIATFKDEMTGGLVERELGTFSEFFIYSEEYRIRYCQEWAESRGNAQHNTILTFVSWRKM